MQETPLRRRYRRPFATLREFFDQTGVRQSDIAADLKISEAHMSNIVSGKRRPSVELAMRMSALTNVPIPGIVQVQA
jgi:transcriptional regulator with XRE-family HTH domain